MECAICGRAAEVVAIELAGAWYRFRLRRGALCRRCRANRVSRQGFLVLNEPGWRSGGPPGKFVDRWYAKGWQVVGFSHPARAGRRGRGAAADSLPVASGGASAESTHATS